MLDRLSARELQEWIAYSRIEPLPDERSDINSAHIVATLASVFRGKGQRPYSIQDCMIEYDAKPVSLEDKARAMFGAKAAD